MKRFLKLIACISYTVIALTITMFMGCASVMPTRVPPLAKELGYNVPNYKGWTAVGINEGVYKVESVKLRVLAQMIEVVNAPMIALHGQVVDWLSVVLAGTAFGGIPLALKTVPKNAIKKEDHDRLIEEAKRHGK